MGKASPNWVICRSNKDKCMLPLKIASIIELLNGIKHWAHVRELTWCFRRAIALIILVHDSGTYCTNVVFSKACRTIIGVSVWFTFLWNPLSNVLRLVCSSIDESKCCDECWLISNLSEKDIHARVSKLYRFLVSSNRTNTLWLKWIN